MTKDETNVIDQELYQGAMYVNGADLLVKDFAPIRNPARLNEVVGMTPMGSPKEIQIAVEAAHAAFPSWAELPIQERAKMVAAAAEAVIAGVEDRAVLLSRENGKTRREAWFDAMSVKRCCEYYVNLAKDFKLEWELPSPNGRVIVIRKPMGVAACIVPWNAPVVLGYLGIAPALVAGNTVIVKPSSSVPLALTDTIRVMAAKLPPGVLNLVTGPGRTIGKELSIHPLIRRMMFTGGVEGGQQVMADSASTLKRCTMELGGNDPALVLKGANLDTAVPDILKGFLTFSGQMCYSIKRIYVQRDLYPQFVKRFTEAADAQVVGNGLDANVTMGPLTTESQFRFVNELISKTKAGGAQVAEVGKKGVSEEEWKNGYFIRPHVATGVSQKDTVVTCEQFGPIIPIMPFDSEEEAVKLANDSEFGLGSSVWTEDLDHAWKLARKIDAGSTFINTHAFASAIDMPFGGFKYSGIGRSHGDVAMEEQYELQTISTRKIS